MQSELKPCPFCGGAPEGKYGSRADINCTSCPAGVSVSLHPGIFTTYEGQRKAEEARAIDAWNRRAALSDKQAVEVKTKPLEWEGELGTEYAASILGLYSVWEGHYRPPGAYGGIRADNPKQAAQDHLERIIRSALVDVPAEEPVASTYSSKLELGYMPSYGNCSANDMLSAVADAIFGDRDISLLRQIDNDRPVGHQMVPTINFNSLNRIISAFHNPPCSPLREGEDSAEVVTLTRAEADRIAQRLEFDASWDKCGDGYYSIKRQLGALAATRSGSATTANGGAE